MPSDPVQLHQRIHYLDIVRGVAITGVLVAYIFWNLGNAPFESYTSFDKVLDKALSFLVDSKCYTLLANLFAVGFVLHMNKAGNSVTNLTTYRRRLLGLAIIGILHAMVLRNGDILVPYAVLSFFITFFYNASNRIILVAMAITFFLQIFIPEAWKFLQLPVPERPTGNNDPYLVDNFKWVIYWYKSSIFFWETTLFFLFSGMLMGRIFIQNKMRLSHNQLVIITVAGSALGAASYWIIDSYSTAFSSLPGLLRGTINSILWLLHRVGLASAYAAVIFLLSKSFSLKIFSTLGRTSLSNYVLQAVIIVPLSLILNLFDHITPTIALIMTTAIWTLQVIVSTWWLKTHQFGPLEWALRRFTYGQLITMKATNP
jgi:uncharacterized protein